MCVTNIYVLIVIENVNTKGMDMCQEHGKTIKFFCEDHCKLCCNTCNTCAFKHRKCDNVDELANISSQEGEELKDLNKTLLQLENESGSIIADCNLSEDVLSETIAGIAKQVDEMMERIIELFDKAKTKIMEEADDFKTEKIKRLGEINKSSSKVNEDINELLPNNSALQEETHKEVPLLLNQSPRSCSCPWISNRLEMIRGNLFLLGLTSYQMGDG
ncbi:hypothetical protein DPMN_144336 [Dreissena polymorpha]|uniref:B box-type domain-containing protein n=1 Tax=Dreissena polymorpha TaxID=45954 RepID=A0A9D4GIQ8_DREPO|nr:hypothetical protein DPMN_144336 [Dreissena polymorpha]